MRFVFDATAEQFDLAAEQEILLRFVSNRKRNWITAVGLCAVAIVLAAVLVIGKFGDAEKTLRLVGSLVGIVLIEQIYLDRSGGNQKGYLKMLYRGRMNQTDEERTAPLRVELEQGAEAMEIFNRDGKAGEWSLAGLRRVTESDDIFELCHGAMLSRRYLALPKSALTEGSVDAFRDELAARVKGGKVERYTIPERMQKQMANTRAKLLGR